MMPPPRVPSREKGEAHRFGRKVVAEVRWSTVEFAVKVHRLREIFPKGCARIPFTLSMETLSKMFSLQSTDKLSVRRVFDPVASRENRSSRLTTVGLPSVESSTSGLGVMSEDTLVIWRFGVNLEIDFKSLSMVRAEGGRFNTATLAKHLAVLPSDEISVTGPDYTILVIRRPVHGMVATGAKRCAESDRSGDAVKRPRRVTG